MLFTQKPCLYQNRKKKDGEPIDSPSFFYVILFFVKLFLFLISASTIGLYLITTSPNCGNYCDSAYEQGQNKRYL